MYLKIHCGNFSQTAAAGTEFMQPEVSNFGIDYTFYFLFSFLKQSAFYKTSVLFQQDKTIQDKTIILSRTQLMLFLSRYGVLRNSFYVSQTSHDITLSIILKLRIHRYEPKIFPVFHKTGGQSLSRSLFLRYRQIFFSEKRGLRILLTYCYLYNTS